MKIEILISIFIPVYNGEKYLEKTLLSIKNQSYKNFEVLIVNNASSDLSEEIIQEFVNQDDRFCLINSEILNSVPKTWNLILPIIKGKFVFYSSQDDLFSIDLLEKMIKRQNFTNADIVLPDMEYYRENIVNNIRIEGLNSNRDIILNGKQAFLESLNWNIHGFGLINKNLFYNEIFPEDAFDSDEFVTRKFFFKSEKVAFSEGVFFYRQDNQYAITKKVDESIFYTLNTLLKLYLFIKDNKFDVNLISEYQYKLQKSYFNFVILSNSFVFKNTEIRLQVLNFLKEFKIKNLQNFKISPNLILLSKVNYVKYFLMNIIFNSEFLFKSVVHFKLVLSKSKL